MAQAPPSLDAYFLDFEQDLKELPVKLKHFLDIESELQTLDSASWKHLKAELAQLLKKRDAKRGWQALFDKLNEAKGYGYLVRLGCTNIRFIPRSSVHGQQTPDLHADLGATKMVCEVKTVNVSELEAGHRTTGSARDVLLQLPDGFFKKLKCDLELARRQLAAASTETLVRKIAYVIINFDDLLHEYVDDYVEQIEKFVATIVMPEVEIVFNIKPPFYSATNIAAEMAEVRTISYA
jgi:hypothetical protein